MIRLRESIIDTFKEKMELRRSLIELEELNVQNKIEIHKRQVRQVIFPLRKKKQS